MKKFSFFFFSVFILSDVFSQGGDNASTALGDPITLPFNASGTTVGKINDYNNPTGFISAYTTGPDWLYYFCATSTGSVTTSLTYTTISSGISPSVSIWEGIPGAGGTLITSVTSPGDMNVDGVLSISYNVEATHCYYVMIDNWPSPNGFPYSISVYLTPVNPSCNNIGFENGDFTGWVATSGEVNEGVASDPFPYYTPTGFTPSSTQHTITTGGNDPIVGTPMPKVCPGLGANSMRLGDGNGTGAKGASIEQQFSVTPSNNLFTYYYAVVFQDNGHNPNEQPVFKVDVLDCEGNSLNCGDYLVVASATVPGFIQLSGTITYYKSWTPVFIDLSPYINSCVTVRFTAGDCTQGGHYGYAYIDAVCNTMEIVGPSTICEGATATLTSPAGGAQYSWTVVGTSTVIGTTQSITVSPLVTTNYQCVITSVTNCQTILTTQVNINPNPIIAGDLMLCLNETSQLTATTAPDVTSSWTSSNVNVATISSTGLVNSLMEGMSTINYIDVNGCVDSVVLTVNPKPIIDNLGDQIACDIYELPVITGLNLTGNQHYYSNSQALGGTVISGSITSSQMIWIYDAEGTCLDEESFMVTINTTPDIFNPGSQTACDSYELPAITGLNLTGNQHYYSNSQALGGIPITGPTTTTQMVWIYDAQGICSDEESFMVTINTTPDIFNPGPQTACDSYELSAITGLNLSGNQHYYNNSQALGGVLITEPIIITTTQTVWIYDNQGLCSDEESFTITIHPTPVINFYPDRYSGCVPLTVVFTNITTPASDNVVWNFGDSNSITIDENTNTITHTFSSIDCFDITLTSTTEGCTSTLTQNDLICTYAYAIADFTASKLTTSILEPSITFTNNSSNASIYSWLIDSDFISSSTDFEYAFPDQEGGTYEVTLIANNSQDCPDSSTLKIVIMDELLYYVPNAFTPEDDLLNSYFTPVFTTGFDPYDFVMYIFNRWGEIVFETHDASRGWSGKYGEDGKKCQDDVYVWKIEFKEKSSSKTIVKTGHVVLIK